MTEMMVLLQKIRALHSSTLNLLLDPRFEELAKENINLRTQINELQSKILSQNESFEIQKRQFAVEIETLSKYKKQTEILERRLCELEQEFTSTQNYIKTFQESSDSLENQAQEIEELKSLNLRKDKAFKKKLNEIKEEVQLEIGKYLLEIESLKRKNELLEKTKQSKN